MSEQFDTQFDGQKLMYHPAEVSRWLAEGWTRGPVYTEVELSRVCNCRCMFCGVDYQVNKNSDRMSFEGAARIIDGLRRIGNKAVMFCGHGEPLLNAEAGEIIGYAAAGMSTSVTTNGIALTPERLEMIDGLAWLRFSINGGTAEVYGKVHGTSSEEFGRVLEHVGAAVARKRARGLGVTIGVQMVLLNENAATAEALCREVRERGADYFSVKPYSRHPLAEHELRVDYEHAAEVERAVTALARGDFKVIFRSAALARLQQRKPYEKCYGTHFLNFISANGDVWECNVYAGDPRFYIGNALEEELEAIWHGARRAAVVRYIAEELHCQACRDLCRMDACNAYLWRLKHPWPHDDFI